MHLLNVGDDYSVAMVQVRRMTEVLGNMKFIKMYAWEKSFTAAIKSKSINQIFKNLAYIYYNKYYL